MDSAFHVWILKILLLLANSWRNKTSCWSQLLYNGPASHVEKQMARLLVTSTQACTVVYGSKLYNFNKSYRSICSSDCSVFLKNWRQLCQTFNGAVWFWMFINFEFLGTLLAFHRQRNNLFNKSAICVSYNEGQHSVIE